MPQALSTIYQSFVISLDVWPILVVLLLHLLLANWANVLFIHFKMRDADEAFFTLVRAAFDDTIDNLETNTANASG